MRVINSENFSANEGFVPKRSQLEKCTNKIHEAHGVPNEYYIQPECFELEGEHLFNKGWFAVGFVKDLPQAGSALPVNYFNNPLLIVRSKQDEKIRSF